MATHYPYRRPQGAGRGDPEAAAQNLWFLQALHVFDADYENWDAVYRDVRMVYNQQNE